MPGLRGGLRPRSGCTARPATEFGPGLIAEDLPEALPAVYRRLFAATGLD